MASIRFLVPTPTKLTIAMVKMEPGKAISISEIRISRLSNTPPANPAAVPMKIPIPATIMVTAKAISRELLPP